MKTPVARKKNKELKIHNHTRIDNYYWLNERDNPDVIRYLKEENEYSETKMKHTENLQQELYNEITGRLDKEESSVPYFLDGYFYSQRFEKGYEYPFFTRKKSH